MGQWGKGVLVRGSHVEFRRSTNREMDQKQQPNSETAKKHGSCPIPGP